MNRRGLLGTIVALSGGGLAGCAGGLEGDSADGDPAGDGSGDPDRAEPDETPRPESYDRCPRLVIRVDELPEPARREVETALSDGHYETSGDLYLPHLLDPRESYIEGEDGHYRVEIDERGATTRLELVEATPNKGSHPLAVENRRDDSLTVDIRITYLPEDAIVLDESASIEPGERSVVGGFERYLGEYRAEVDAGDVVETLTWREEEHVDPFATVVIEGEDAYPEPRAVAELIPCSDVWDG